MDILPTPEPWCAPHKWTPEEMLSLAGCPPETYRVVDFHRPVVYPIEPKRVPGYHQKWDEVPGMAGSAYLAWEGEDGRFEISPQGYEKPLEGYLFRDEVTSRTVWANSPVSVLGGNAEQAKRAMEETEEAEKEAHARLLLNWVEAVLNHTAFRCLPPQMRQELGALKLRVDLVDAGRYAGLREDFEQLWPEALRRLERELQGEVLCSFRASTRRAGGFVISASGETREPDHEIFQKASHSIPEWVEWEVAGPSEVALRWERGYRHANRFEVAFLPLSGLTAAQREAIGAIEDRFERDWADDPSPVDAGWELPDTPRSVRRRLDGLGIRDESASLGEVDPDSPFAALAKLRKTD